MSFDIVKLENSPFLSKEGNELLTKYYSMVVPNDKFILESNVPKNLEITPYIGATTVSTDLDAILNFDVRADDIFVCSLMKCGSSWVHNIVWLLTNGLDFETNRNVEWKKLMGNFEDFTKLRSTKETCSERTLKDDWKENFGNMKSPRVLKAHSPVYFLPMGIWSKQAKVIYIVRNPKDAVVSEYHFLRNAFHCDITMDDVVNGVINDAWLFCPRFSHILNCWRIRHLPNVCFIVYEDLVTDTFATIQKISEFLNFSYTDAQLMELVEYSSFDNMKEIEAVNREKDLMWMENKFGKQRPDAGFKFLRKGRVGAYRDELNEDQIKKLDDWIEKCLKDTDFKFKL